MNFTADPSALTRIRALCTAEKRPFFRLSVDSGGCAGFSYVFGFADKQDAGDHVIDGILLIDAVSVPFLNGGALTFKDDLSGSQFVVNNPNATGGCGCGTSFAV